MTIDHINLTRVDLILLVALDALLAERSVTRAAARLGLGQSAMSHNLARLRKVFRDEILIRRSDGMRPTPKALSLAGPVRIALAQIQATVLDGGDFDPATTARTFRIGIPDSLEVALVPPLLAHLRRAAPEVRLQLRSTAPSEVPQLLESDQLDVGVSMFNDVPFHHKRRRLYSDGYLCVFDSQLVKVEPPISLEDYVRLPHVLGSLSGDSRGVVDDALAKLGLRRMVVLATPHFISVPFVLKRAPVISTLPAKLARYFAATFHLSASPLPIELEGFTISLLWHASHDHDPAHSWLRDTLMLVANETAMEP
jgi:DNA-binding transcriptional LysR family regulator